MSRIAPLVAAAVALALAAAASPAAAQSVRPVAFVASLKVDVAYRWVEPEWTSYGCNVVTTSAGSGEERWTIRTTPIRVRLMKAGRDAVMAYGPPRRPLTGMPGKGQIRAEHDMWSEYQPGSCPGYVDIEDRRDAHVCRDAHQTWTVQFIGVQGRFGPTAVQERPADVLDRCTVYRPDGASSIWKDSGVRVPWKELRDRDQEYVVLSGRKTVRQDLVIDEVKGHHRDMTASIRWTLRMRRAR